MAIALVCPNCSANLKVKDDSAGKTIACPTCGSAIEVASPAIPVLKAATSAPTKFCHECGASIRKKARICPECGVEQPRPRESSFDEVDESVNGKKMAAGLCGIFLGGLGVHKFILGYNRAGLIMLLSSVFTCGIGYTIVHIIGLIEGILYITKSDAEFQKLYLDGKKEWF
jgi:TM2 domain-containing membrane protein YozV/predicted RNA-binding Zn-ribbon protein involved in translation (DUF1610 family)